MEFKTFSELVEHLGGPRKVAYEMNYHLSYLRSLCYGTDRVNERVGFRLLTTYPQLKLEQIRKLIQR